MFWSCYRLMSRADTIKDFLFLLPKMELEDTTLR